MLQFVAPLGLLALGALLAPILLHLVRRPRRVVKVGSLRPIEDARRQSRSLRWHELWLLALRCALLAALALSLAGPEWQPRSAVPIRWLLHLPGATLNDSDREQWERLRSDGFEPRMLAPRFPRHAPTEPAPSEVALDAWSILRELDERAPAGSRVTVFGPTWSTLFRGSRPTLENVEVSWRETAGDAPTEAPRPRVRVGIVAAPDREEDARYVRAAMAAIGASMTTDDAPDWIFQLGEAALPDGWRDHLSKSARLVTDAPNAATAAQVAQTVQLATGPVRILKRATIETGVPILRDSAGAPILSEQRQDAGVHWRFALRFHPDWTDWPLESSFPAWWQRQLRLHSEPPTAISAAQAAPHYAPVSPPTLPSIPTFGDVDLRGRFWILAVVLFAVERGISWAQRQKATA